MLRRDSNKKSKNKTQHNNRGEANSWTQTEKQQKSLGLNQGVYEGNLGFHRGCFR